VRRVGQLTCEPVWATVSSWPAAACLTRADLVGACCVGGSFGGLTGCELWIGSLSVCSVDFSGWIFLAAGGSPLYSGMLYV
jgi:hypothetical protein